MKAKFVMSTSKRTRNHRVPNHHKLLESGTATKLRAYRSAESSIIKMNRMTHTGSADRKMGVTGMKERTS